MDVLAIIPARGGSKGISGKNLRSVGGMSLIGRAVRLAKSSACVTRTVVSTDDLEIASEARNHGAEVIERPEDISGDMSSSEATLLHVLETLSESEGYRPQVTVFLQCTAPLTQPEDVNGTVDVLLENGTDAAFAAISFHHFIWRNEGDNNWQGVNHDHRVRQMRQERPEEVMEAGAVYAFLTEAFQKVGHRFCGSLAVWTMPRDRFLEIDEPDDLKLANALVSPRAQPLPCPAPKAAVFDFDGVLTDNRVWVDKSGNEMVSCSRGDGMGIEMLQNAGVPVLILSKETDGVVGARAKKLNVEVIQNCDDKITALRAWAANRGIDMEHIIYAGNDTNDVACMGAVGFAIAPADAHPSAKSVADYVSETKGGNGIAREIADLVLNSLEKFK